MPSFSAAKDRLPQSLNTLTMRRSSHDNVFGAAALSKTRLVADAGRALAGFGGAMIGRCSYVDVRRKRKT